MTQFRLGPRNTKQVWLIPCVPNGFGEHKDKLCPLHLKKGFALSGHAIFSFLLGPLLRGVPRQQRLPSRALPGRCTAQKWRVQFPLHLIIACEPGMDLLAFVSSPIKTEYGLWRNWGLSSRQRPLLEVKGPNFLYVWT